MPGQNKKLKDKTIKFFQSVEAGDLALFDIFEKAFLVFGFTKVGKTSSCHFLSDSILISKSQNGDLYWEPTGNMYASAKIGVGIQSQTEIPNVFTPEILLQNGDRLKIALMDQPGYGDSYGFHRIYSNGYFHYRTFSKTPHLKFILTFDSAQFGDTGNKIKETIFNFIKAFKQYEKISEDILNATVFMLTKVDTHIQTIDIENKFRKLIDGEIENMKQDKQQIFRDIINHMISNKKIYLIRKPHTINIQTQSNEVLADMNKKTKFWSRKVLQNNIVSMDEINFSVASEILDKLTANQKNQVFIEDYEYFMKFSQERINNFLFEGPNSLKNIIMKLKDSAIGQIGDRNYLKGMQELVKKQYNFMNQNGFQEVRNKLELQLFAVDSSSRREVKSTASARRSVFDSPKMDERQQREQEAKLIYFIQKFKVLQSVWKKCHQLFIRIPKQKIQRSIEYLENIAKEFKDIFKEFDKLRQNNEDSTQIIYKYCYLILRNIEQAKILTLILFNDQEIEKKFEQNERSPLDIYRPLKDILLTNISALKIDELKRNFVQKMDLAKFEVVNEEVITFFQEIPKCSNKIILNTCQFVLQFSESTLSKLSQNRRDRKFAAAKLIQYRTKIIEIYEEAKQNHQNKEQQEAVFLIFQISNTLGSVFESMDMLQFARESYKSVHNVNAVLEAYEKDIEIKSKSLTSQRKIDVNSLNRETEYIQLLWNAADYASQTLRFELATKYAQKAYSKSRSYEHLKKSSQKIVNINIKQTEQFLEDRNEQEAEQFDQKIQSYKQNMYDEKFFEKFDEDVLKKIQFEVEVNQLLKSQELTSKK